MSDLRDGIRRAAEKHQPPADWLERINERARTRRRNRRLAAGAVGLGIPIVLLVVLLVNLASSGDSTPAVKPLPEWRCQGGSLPEPTVYWSADGTSTDAVSGVEAVLRGNALYGRGIAGQAFALDGDGDFIEVPDSRSPKFGSQAFTISFWVRFWSTQGKQVLMEDWIETLGPSARGWTLTKDQTNTRIVFVSDAGSVAAGGPDLPATWFHVAVRRANGQLSLFMDGLMVANNAMRYPTKSIDSASSLKFGHRGSPADTPGSRDDRGFFLTASIDEIAMYLGNPLSDSEIQQIFEAQGSCLP